MKVQIEVSVGELIDKITILELKKQKISDPIKLKNILFELSILVQVKKQLNISVDLSEYENDLHKINLDLWEIEDRLRQKEKYKIFDSEFIEMSRNVYLFNDKRAATKRQIDNAVGSEIIEEKSYENYQCI